MIPELLNVWKACVTRFRLLHPAARFEEWGDVAAREFARRAVQHIGEPDFAEAAADYGMFVLNSTSARWALERQKEARR